MKNSIVLWQIFDSNCYVKISGLTANLEIAHEAPVIAKIAFL